MNFPLSVELISAILGRLGPFPNVTANWPLVEASLDGCQIYSPLTAVAAIATIAVETGAFCPLKERGGPAYLTNLYENRSDLGNDQPGDGVKFRGRGFVQITGRWDYQHFGEKIGVDLLGNPDAALNPAIAAEILAWYFAERQIRQYADQQNWEMVRRRVNGGLNAWQQFIDAVTKLVSALNNPPATAGIPQEATNT
jgi:predicted chitinase